MPAARRQLCRRRLLPAERAIRLPDAIGFDVAAAVLVRGLTAHMLFERCGRCAPATRC